LLPRRFAQPDWRDSVVTATGRRSQVRRIWCLFASDDVIIPDVFLSVRQSHAIVPGQYLITCVCVCLSVSLCVCVCVCVFLLSYLWHTCRSQGRNSYINSLLAFSLEWLSAEASRVLTLTHSHSDKAIESERQI